MSSDLQHEKLHQMYFTQPSLTLTDFFRLSPNWSVVACFHGYSQRVCKDVQE